jgi:hypothetical protein
MFPGVIHFINVNGVAGQRGLASSLRLHKESGQ